MHIYKIQLHDFQKKCVVKINDLDQYNVEEEYIGDEMHQSFSEINIEQHFHVKKYNFELSNSEIFNYITHRNIWTNFLKKDKPWCMIIESNVNITASFEDIIYTISTMPNDWDIFFPYDANDFYERSQMNKGMTLLNPNIREMRDAEPYLLRFQWCYSCNFIEPGTNCPYYKVWHEDGESINGYNYTFPFIDIWVYNVIDKDLVF